MPDRFAAAIYNGWWKLHRACPRGKWDRDVERELARRRSAAIIALLGPSLDREDVINV